MTNLPAHVLAQWRLEAYAAQAGLTPKAYSELTAVHEAAHAVVAARLRQTVKKVSIGKGMIAHVKLDGRSSRTDDILITLAGYAADLRMARLSPRYRTRDQYNGPANDLTAVFAMIAQQGRPHSIFPRFRKSLQEAEQILAEPNTWAAVRKVAAVLLKQRTLTQQEFAKLIAHVTPRER
jgi:hypothetical protein